jgi:PIN like domain
VRLAEPFSFFIDRSLGGAFVAAAIREVGHSIVVHDDEFESDARDVDWLREVGRVAGSSSPRTRVEPLPPADSEKTLACTRDFTQVRDLTLFAVSFRSFARISRPVLEKCRNQRIFAFKTAAFDHSATPPTPFCVNRCDNRRP